MLSTSSTIAKSATSNRDDTNPITSTETTSATTDLTVPDPPDSRPSRTVGSPMCAHAEAAVCIGNVVYG
jgi:hypothetical protein